jgi:hypothetical protein
MARARVNPASTPIPFTVSWYWDADDVLVVTDDDAPVPYALV